MRASEGPFRCGNCEYWKMERDSCIQKNMIELAKSGEYGLEVNGRGEATPLRFGDCSDFYSHK